MKRVTWGLCAVLALAILVWGACILQTHWRVNRALSALSRHFLIDSSHELLGDDSERLVLRLQTEGYKALPSLIAELDPQADSKYLTTVTSIAISSILRSHFHERGSDTADRVRQEISALQVREQDSPVDRQGKCTALRKWWAENGGGYHQWWRFWSTACKAPIGFDF